MFMRQGGGYKVQEWPFSTRSSAVFSMASAVVEGKESVLESIYEEEEGEAINGDVEMLDAETLDGRGKIDFQDVNSDAKSTIDGDGDDRNTGHDSGGGSSRHKARNKKKRRNRRKNKESSDFGLTNINRFVINTCRHLKERKSYLLWNAVGCLGVSAVQDLVKEVDAIQGGVGQKTADGKRWRNGGGVLWNILKTREPKAYKEIMAKGKELEKQFRIEKTKQVTKGIEAAISHSANVGADQVLESTRPTAEVQPQLALSSSQGGRVSVLNRIRVPVAYDDLFEEGEIVES